MKKSVRTGLDVTERDGILGKGDAVGHGIIFIG